MKNIAIAAALLALTGCASITGKTTQPIAVQTVFEAKEVIGANCTLENDAGKWTVVTPGSVTVHKSTGDMAVQCTKVNELTGQLMLVSKSNLNVWGNVIAGGLVGYVVDRQTGAGFDYPNMVSVEMRKMGPATAAAPAVKTEAAGAPQPK